MLSDKEKKIPKPCPPITPKNPTKFFTLNPKHKIPKTSSTFLPNVVSLRAPIHMQPPRFSPAGRRTNPLIWILAIICAILSSAVIIAGVAVFVVYLVIHPRVPFISVTSAHLDNIQYDQAGQLETQVAIYIRAENDNAKAHSSFSDTSFILSFQGLQIAKLVAGPFDVSKNSSVEFEYVVQSSQIPLDRLRMEEVDQSLKRDQITFDLKGSSRARWRVLLLGSVKFGCWLNCQLKFRPSNGTYTSSRCTSKSK